MVVGADAPVRIVGRYALYGEIAAGGMATVHYGRLLGPVGFSRTVAIKRLHAHYARDPEFVSMFLDEARLAARIRHPNAVPTLDVVALEGELFVVMDYVQGESLSRLLRHQRGAGEAIPLAIVGAILGGVLHGLHAAHEAVSERGEPLGLVHRDVSPHNVMVGVDGVARVLDFGVAKAAGQVHTTREGQVKGKLPYMAPEQIRGEGIDRRVDVYAAAVVLWEMLAGRHLFRAENDGALFSMVVAGAQDPPSRYQLGLPWTVDAIVMRGLTQDPADRFATAREMAIAIEETFGVASPRQVGEWTERFAGASLAARAERVKDIESASSVTNVMAPAALPAPSSAPRPKSPSARGDRSEPQSQMSSVSVSGNTPVQPAPPTRTALLVVAALAIAAAGGTLVWMGQRLASGGASDPAAAAPSKTEDPRAVAASAPPAPASAVAIDTAAPAASTARAAASASSPPETSVRAVAPAHRTATPAPVRKPSKANCNPPFTVDSAGIKRPKPECL